MGRIMLIILDGVGVGALPDAAEYGDEGSNSLGNAARAIGGIELPNLQRLGLGNLTPIMGVPEVSATHGAYGKMAERSSGKDTITGHWEMMGVIRERPWPVYPNGFPPEVIKPFEQQTGRKVIGNIPASGTEIIKKLGDEHVKTGALIVYTSADSVFQIAAHEEIVPIGQLYEFCKVARNLLCGEHEVGRVIARPFIGAPGNYTRTGKRRDWSIDPPPSMLLNTIKAAGHEVLSIGKIDDIFCCNGITRSNHTTNNRESTVAIIETLKQEFSGVLFANLIDFDQDHGHRRNPLTYLQAMKEFDDQVPAIQKNLRDDDIVMITSDHGVDPTFKGTDHTREYVPLLVFGEKVKPGVGLGIRSSFADIGATVAEYLGVGKPGQGTSFIKEIV